MTTGPDLGPAALTGEGFVEARVAAAGRPDPALYEAFARPELGRRLRALGLDVAYDRAEGDWLEYEDRRGTRRRVLDLLGGYGTGLFGHHHPALVAALRAGLDDLTPVMAQASVRGWSGELAAALARKLAAEAGGEWVITLVNTGAEAVEAALKHAELARAEDADEADRRFRRRMGALAAEAGPDQAAFLREASRELGVACPDVPAALAAVAAANEAARARPPVYFALERAFHGKTTGAVQVTANEAYRRPFARVGPRCEFLPADDPAAWERAVARATGRTWEVRREGDRLVLAERPWVNVSAILVEPVQGEGGIHALTTEQAAMIRAVADAHDVPVIVDEIQCGLGRAGTFLAATGCGLRGDYLVFAKALGGGLVKVGALAVEKGRYRPDFGLLHTSTFAEDDLSSRVALRALRLVDEADVPGRARRLGDRLLGRLAELAARWPEVLEGPRGRGLMLGLAFKPQDANPSNVIRMLSDQGLLGYALAAYLLHEDGIRVAPTLSSPLTLRIEPSAFVAEAELDRFVDALDRLCGVIARADAYRLTRHQVGLAGLPGEPGDFRAATTHLRREPARSAKRVAFVGHFIGARDAMLWDPSLGQLPADAVASYQLAAHHVLGPTIYDRVHVTSAIGEEVHLSFIGLNLTSKAIEQAMRARDTGWILDQIDGAVAIAREAGCQVVGLGGFTSIVSDNGRRLSEGGVAVTTGNSLTVGMGLAALRRGAAAMGLDPAREAAAVLGATGNIGTVHARLLAHECPRVLLLGRESGARLGQVAARIYQDAWEAIQAGGPLGGVAAAIVGTAAVRRLPAEAPARPGEWLAAALAEELGAAAPVVVSADLADLRSARLIVAATNSAAPVILPEHVADGPVVICDLAVPTDVDPSVAARSDVRVIRGGLVAVPNDPAFVIGGLPLPRGHAFACMAETLLLGLVGVREHFSYGPVRPEQVRQAMAWAAAHGFALGDDKTERSY